MFLQPANVLSSFKATTFVQIHNNSFQADVILLQALHQVLEQVFDGGNAFVYAETSVSGTGREMMLRTEKMTYTSSPTCSFSYALYSTTATDVGRTRLFWIEDAS